MLKFASWENNYIAQKLIHRCNHNIPDNALRKLNSVVPTLHMVSKPTVVSTNWFLRSPFKVTGTPTTCSIKKCPEVTYRYRKVYTCTDARDPELS
jgi:hypothetical protein